MLPSAIETALPSLSREDLIELSARTTFLLGRTSSTPADDELAEAVARFLSKTGRGRIPPAVVRKNAPKTFGDAASAIAEFVASQNPKARAERLLVFDLVVAAVADRLLAMKVPVTSGSLLSNLPSFRDAIEDAFPGYAASGLLIRVVRSASIPA